MLHSYRIMKRVKIASVVIVFLIGVGTLWYFVTKPAATCFDGKRNQNEAGIDCGGPCGVACAEAFNPDTFVVRESGFVPGSARNEYDAFGIVHNPNGTIGASAIGYDIILRDMSGAEVGRASGTDSLLPQETKTLLSIGIVTTGIPATAEVSFRDASWQRFSGYQERPPLVLYRTRYDKLSSGPYFGEAFGTLRNDSSFDFRTVTVKIILRDASGKAVALNQTDVNTLLSGDNRDFTLIWPTAFSGDVAKADMEADADFFHEDNFIQRYRTGTERFQKLQ